jgi:serine/threonine protein phosphatase PrpC
MDAIAISQGELIDWAVAARPLPGEARSGDAHLVEPSPSGVLVAVVDGLGHGEEAADAATTATDILARHVQEAPVSLVQRCHQGLLRTRGVAMSLAAFDRSDHEVSWLGVGNVEASLFRSCPGSRPVRDSLILRGGVVGYRLPRLQSTVVALERDDVLVMSTDGIRGFSLDGLGLAGPPARIAASILGQFALDTDDALVLVARYRGTSA